MLSFPKTCRGEKKSKNKNEFVLPGFQKRAHTKKKIKKIHVFAQWFVPALQTHKLVNTAARSHLYKNLIRKRVCKKQKKKRVRNMLLYFYKGGEK